MSRSGLRLLVALAAGIALLGLLTVFSGSLRPSERAISAGIAEIDLAGLEPGAVRKFSTRRGPIFAYRPTPSTLDELTRPTPYVGDPQVDSYSRELGVFLVLGVSTLHGCALIPVAPDDPQFPINYAFWHGGYLDPCHGAIYDYAGRAIDTGLNARNLEPAKVRSTSGTTAWLQLWDADRARQ